MYLVFKNKLVSMSGSSKVTNEKGEQVYTVKGSLASNMFSKKYAKTIVDMKGNVIYRVCNQRIHGPLKRACFIYDKNKNEVAYIAQSGGLNGNFVVEGTTEKMEIIRSSISCFDIMLGNKKIGSIGPERKDNGKVKINLADTLRVDFDDPNDASFLVAVLVAMDNINDGGK